MRVLVTGGAGFIGGHVAVGSRLSRRPAPSHSELDLTDAGAVDGGCVAHPVDAVVHAAVKPGTATRRIRPALPEQNLLQFFGLVRTGRRFGRRFVVGLWGHLRTQRPLSGSRRPLGRGGPGDEHGLSKYVEGVWLAGDPDAVELRPFGVYGPGEDYSIRFVSNACCKALLGMPVTLRQDRLFSYVWVADLAAVVESALGEGPGRLAPGRVQRDSGEPVALRAVADLAVAASGNRVPVRRCGVTRRRRSTPATARGWRPRRRSSASLPSSRA